MSKHITQKGFTIVETLVAIGILMISIAGPLTIAHKGLRSALLAHDQVTASYLAQDAMEYLKNVRDINIIEGRDWTDGINLCSDGQKCSVNTLTGNPSTAPGTTLPTNGLSPCVPSTTCKIYKSSGGYSDDSSGTELTKFSRYFYYIPGGDISKDATIVVIVEWKNGTVTNQVKYENVIYNVQK